MQILQFSQLRSRSKRSVKSDQSPKDASASCFCQTWLWVTLLRISKASQCFKCLLFLLFSSCGSIGGLEQMPVISGVLERNYAVAKGLNLKAWGAFFIFCVMLVFGWHAELKLPENPATDAKKKSTIMSPFGNASLNPEIYDSYSEVQA